MPYWGYLHCETCTFLVWLWAKWRCKGKIPIQTWHTIIIHCGDPSKDDVNSGNLWNVTYSVAPLSSLTGPPNHPHLCWAASFFHILNWWYFSVKYLFEFIYVLHTLGLPNMFRKLGPSWDLQPCLLISVTLHMAFSRVNVCTCKVFHTAVVKQCAHQEFM